MSPADLIARLSKALEPFAKLADDIDEFDPTTPGTLSPRHVDRDDMITIADCREARDCLRALAAQGDASQPERPSGLPSVAGPCPAAPLPPSRSGGALVSGDPQ